MKILVPLNKLEHVDQLIEAGTDEFYIGFYDDNWVNTFGNFSDLNRMSGFQQYANSMNFEQLLEAIQYIRACEKEVYVTFNANVYTNEQIIKIEEYFQKLKEVDVTGVIVNGIELVKSAEKFAISVVASTMCCVYNSDVAKYYIEHGINRIIFPRDVSLDEMQAIISRNPKKQYEVFAMRNGCRFSDGYCLGTHRVGCGAVCALLRKEDNYIDGRKGDFLTQHEIELNNLLYRQAYRKDACALCAIYRLKKMGITSLKIVGRADNYNNICQDVMITKQNIEIAEQCDTEEEYLERMLFPRNRFEQCKLGYSCYYPEVRFGK